MAPPIDDVTMELVVQERKSISKLLAKERREKNGLIREMEAMRCTLKEKDAEIQKLGAVAQSRERNMDALEKRNETTQAKLDKANCYADRLERVVTFADSEGELASMFGDIKDKVAVSDVVESYKSYLSDKRSNKAISLFFSPPDQDPIMTLQQYMQTKSPFKYAIKYVSKFDQGNYIGEQTDVVARRRDHDELSNSLFSRVEYQMNSGNLPHEHAILDID